MEHFSRENSATPSATSNTQIDIKSTEETTHLLPQQPIPTVQQAQKPYSFGHIFKMISALAIPMALSFTFSFELFLMALLLNKIDESSDKAVATTAATALITGGLSFVMVFGFSPLLAMNMLARKKLSELKAEENSNRKEEISEQISDINKNGIVLGISMSVPIVAALTFSKEIFRSLRQNEHVAELAQNFLRKYIIAVLPLMLRVSSEQMMFSFGKSVQAMIIGLVNLTIGIGIAVWCGFGGLGLPQYGSTGIAIGFITETFLTGLLFSLYIAYEKDFKNFKFFSFKKSQEFYQSLTTLIKFGLSFILSNGLEMSISLIIGIMSGWESVNAQSAMSYVLQIVFFSLIATYAFGSSCAQEICGAIGAKNYENANRIGKYGLLTSLIYITPIPLLISSVPKILGAASAVHDILTKIVPIMSAGIIIDCMRFNLLQQLRAVGDIFGSTLVSGIMLAAGMGLAEILRTFTTLGIYAIGTGYAAGNFLAAASLWIRWSSRIQANSIKTTHEQSLQQPTTQIQTSSSQGSCWNSVTNFFGCCKKKAEERLLPPDEILNSTYGSAGATV